MAECEEGHLSVQGGNAMASLYICEQGVKVARDGGRIVVKKHDEVLQSIRVNTVERIIARGNVQFTAQCIAFLLAEDIPVSLLSCGNRLKGTVRPPFGKNNLRRVAQYRLADNEEWCTVFARSVVTAKIRNSFEYIWRYVKHHPECRSADYEETVASFLEKVPSVSGNSLMGIEGYASRLYYFVLGKMVPEEFIFENRNRRPPQDPVNAMLSLGYTLLCGEMGSVLEAHGLDPGVGFYHALSYGKPALALDMVEEFRSVVIDRFVMYVIQQRCVNPGDFEMKGDEGCRFHPDALKRYYHEYETWMTRDLGLRYAVTWRDLMMRQAERIAGAVDNGREYHPLVYGEKDVCCGEL